MVNQLKMADTQTILSLHAKGWSTRRIARELGMNRETVARYIRLQRIADSGASASSTGPAASTRVPVDSKPAIAPSGSGNPDSCVAASFSDLAQTPVDSKTAIPSTSASASAAPAVSTDAGRQSTAAPWRAVILEKLKQGLGAQRIYQDITAPEHGYHGSYYSVRRLVARLSEHSELPMRRMECAPGIEAQVDFGRGAWLVDAGGKRRGTWVLRIILSHSRKGYSEAVLRQTTHDFLRCLENAFFDFGGVPQTLVIDNLRAAVSRADWYDPEFCPKVRSFAEHYQVAILPTKPYTPRHKGKIENGVKYVKNNALKARTFSTLADQNQHLRQWEQTVADTRIHGTTRQQVIGVFTQSEKPALQPLPPSRFELFEEALRNVHRDGHVQVRGAYYSVGPEYLGHGVWVRWDGRMVRIFDSRMNPIAVHAQVPAGQFSTQSRHIASEKISGIERGTAWLLGRVEVIGPQSKAWAQQMLQVRGIQGVRVLLGLVSLSHQFSPSTIELACRASLEHRSYHLRGVRQLIALSRSGQEIPQQGNLGFIQEHQIIRPMADYGQFIRDALTGQASAIETSNQNNKEIV